jgi:dihydrofolate reductase
MSNWSLLVNITLIWAQGHKRAIGRNNTLPWHIPEDFAHFKNITKGRPVLMGRKTWDSLPRKPLPGRINMVLSRDMEQPPGAQVFASIADVLAYCEQQQFEELVVIGGAQLYEAFLGRADQVWITHVDLSVPDADAFAPELNASEWKVRIAHSLNSNPASDALLYVRA